MMQRPNAKSGSTYLLQFLRRSETRQALVITLGSVLAQVVLLGTIPILSRLFRPEAFGHLAVLTNFSTIGGAIAALCYPFVIFLPKSNLAAAAAFRLNVYLSVAGSAFGTAACAALLLGFDQARRNLGLDLSLVYFGILLTSLFTIIGNAESRFDRFWSVAVSKLNNSLIPSTVQIVLGLAGAMAYGLQIGRVFGQLVTVAFMFRNLPKGFRARDLLRPKWRELRLIAFRYGDAPLHVPRVLAVRLGGSLTATMILTSYGATLAGFYFIAERLIERPGMLLSDTLMRLPMKIFAERVREGRPVARAALKYTVACAVLVLPGVLILALGGPWFLTTFLGRDWAGAEQFILIVALSTGVKVAVLPMSALVVVLRIHSWSMFIDFAFLPRVLIIPASAFLGYSVTTAVLAMVALTICYHLLMCVVTFSAALTYDRKLRQKLRQT